ncbi:MAG: TonB-dependent receptor, partial [Candidatus Neomarinimicrobiota bacterium]
MRKILVATFCLLLFSITFIYAGVTGKISGRVVDATTGEPLVGVNVVIEGTTMGAATDIDGNFVILNIPPGLYDITASMIGYANYTIRNARVEIDLTTTLDFRMKQEVLKGEVVEVIAQRKVIKKDVAGSQRSVTSKQIEALPVSSITGVLGLQAGITSELSIRGSNADESIFMVDGVILRDERNNQPMTSLPMSAVQEISVQSGGFTAEYNNVRAGVVNVVTREGNKDHYSGTFTIRYSPPAPKHFGISPYDPNSFWLRPFLDPDVCWEGTDNGAWDKYKKRQYQNFNGWNTLSQKLLSDDDPDNDLTPSAAKRIFEWQYRKKGYITEPDRTIDFGFGGPVPFISDILGNLRFYISHRTQDEKYMIKLSRDGLLDKSNVLKITSDLSSSMKLTLLGIYGETKATSISRSGGTSYFDDPWDIADQVDRRGFTVPWRIYTDIYYCPTSKYYNTISLKLNKMITSGSFYTAQIKRISKRYHTNHPAYRDTSRIYEVFPGYFIDEAPIGFMGGPIFSIDGGLALGGAVSTSRDFSDFTALSAKFDYVNQVNFRHQLKTGFEFIQDYYDFKFGMENEFLPEGNYWTYFKRNPYRISAYIQDKIEYEGFITTLGLIQEYISSNGKWYDVGLYERDFFSTNFTDEMESIYKTKKVKPKFYLSPRLAISHPITVNSKLYFNYGHYREMPTAQNLYRYRRSSLNQLQYVGNPTLPLSRTISYELGYDQALFNNYLLHIAAYYKSIDFEENWTDYISIDGKVNYSKLTANYYRDIRGFEIEFFKQYGRWITGNVNYEYRVGTSGYFGVGEYNENPADQRNYLRRNPYQQKPRPRPRMKSYVDFHTPEDFGISIMNHHPFGGWHCNLIGNWTAGYWTTWNPNNIPGIIYNLQYRSYHNVDLKISKVFNFGKTKVKVFADIYNALN